MAAFLENNGPWSLLIEAGHIEIMPIANGQAIRLNERLTITPILVPHRDEFSETVGFRIEGPQRSVLFFPDIDKWTAWDTLGGSIEAEIARVDVAYIDGTFFANGEIPGRDMSDIPHPFIEESMERFASLPTTEQNKIRFIHFNHTNPVLRPDTEAVRQVQTAGFSIAEQSERVNLGVDAP
jgi:pyrroloquinoline quinone biosynthesis protein B